MMSGQPQMFDGAGSLDKHTLAGVLDFIKKRNLKVCETFARRPRRASVLVRELALLLG